VIKQLEDQSKQKEAIILSYMAEVCSLSSECKRIELLQRESEDLKSKMEMMTTINSLLTSTATEVDEILSKDLDTKTLAVTVASLRRELKASDYRKNQLRKVLTGFQNDLRNEAGLRKRVEEKLSAADSEIYQLKQTVEALQAGKTAVEVNSGRVGGSLKRSFTDTSDSPSIVSRFFFHFLKMITREI
jgi:TRAF-interacting protein